ncbi:MAG: MOSC domain-containing protein [Bacteroidota bacterium]
MKITSTNIGKSTTVAWNGKQVQTGIFKYPISRSLDLEKEVVAGDSIADRNVHGGTNKACYLFSKEQYPYWKHLYPDLDWDWGMFGENLTIEGMDESQIRIGNIYKIGTALVQVSLPREPCYKLGIRFKDQGILKQFIDHGHPGAYVRILNEGSVQKGDKLILETESKNTLTVAQFYTLLYAKEKNIDLVKIAVQNTALPRYKRERLKKYLAP